MACFRKRDKANRDMTKYFSSFLSLVVCIQSIIFARRPMTFEAFLGLKSWKDRQAYICLMCVNTRGLHRFDHLKIRGEL